jgi:3-deoxy-D-manno-octulosonic-acid transferase
MDNFRPMANEFLEAGAAVEVSGSDELGRELDHLLSNPELARTIALSGHRLLEKNRGATEAALDAILGPKSPVMG